MLYYTFQILVERAPRCGRLRVGCRARRMPSSAEPSPPPKLHRNQTLFGSGSVRRARVGAARRANIEKFPSNNETQSIDGERQMDRKSGRKSNNRNAHRICCGVIDTCIPGDGRDKLFLFLFLFLCNAIICGFTQFTANNRGIIMAKFSLRVAYDKSVSFRK